jgi:hypothetical protein
LLSTFAAVIGRDRRDIMIARSLLLALSVLMVCSTAATSAADQPDKITRIGLIGLDTSHVIAFTKIINNPQAKGDLAQMQVVAGYPGGTPDNPSSYTRVDKYTEQLRSQGIKIFDAIEEMLPHVDAVLLESVDGRPHLEQARPVIAAGKPLFIDKPLAGSLTDAVKIFNLAQQAGVPCFSSSSLRFAPGFQAARDYETSEFGRVKECLAWSGMSIEPHHPDLFWYGIHGVETLFTIMGTGCQTVTRLAQNKVVGTWAGGRTGTFEGRKGYGAEVVGEKASGSAGGFGGYEPLVIEIGRFFKTGKPPVSMEETLEIYAFMEAADESKRRDGKPVTIAEVLQKAQAAAAELP